MGWRYKTVGSCEDENAPSKDKAELGVSLNELGADGWELVGIVNDKMVFKRDDGSTFEKERGQGMGRGGARQGDGGASVCVCQSCGETIAHARGTPCTAVKCPKCGGAMIGKEKVAKAMVECPECGHVMDAPPGEPLDGIVCPECGHVGMEIAKVGKDSDKYSLTKEDRDTLEEHLAMLASTVGAIRKILKAAGDGGKGGETEKVNPLDSIHACMTCDDFTPDFVDQEEGVVGGTCEWKKWATNGMSDCNGWVAKGTSKEEKDRIRAVLEEETGDGKD